jgi:hypothetical protein
MIGDNWLSAADAAAYATALASEWGRVRLPVRTLLELARKRKIVFRSGALPPVGLPRPGRPHAPSPRLNGIARSSALYGFPRGATS